MDDTIFKKPTFSETVERLLARLRKGSLDALKVGVAAGSIGLIALAGLPGCDSSDDEAGPDDEGEGEVQTPHIPLPGGVKADWAQDEGSRNTDMVLFTGESWVENKPCYERFCGAADVLLKVNVLRQDGADLNSKRVGVVASKPGSNAVGAFVGEHYADLGGGWEEWHVRVVSNYSYQAYYPIFTFNVWYQDGKGNTYYDDNQGEFHVVNHGATHNALSQVWCCRDVLTDVHIDENGVGGAIRLQVSDLDYDKAIELVYTTDDWATVNRAPIASEEGQSDNYWHWVEDSWSGTEIWEIRLNLPGDFQKFEYAIVYHHGVVNDAQTYDFWDNNGGRNYVVTRAEPVNPEDLQ